MAIRLEYDPFERLREQKKYSEGLIENSDLKKKNKINSRMIICDLRGPERRKSSPPTNPLANKVF